MSISPPGDIVLDVARAADPARYREAAARLGDAAAVGAEFQTALKAEAPAPPAPPAIERPASAPPSVMAAAKPPASKPEKANQDFEAMVLSNLLEAAMPDDSAAVFGEGTAGSVWKSMLVEQIANQMTKAGGIGIAAQIARASQLALGATPDPDATRTMLVHQAQRGFVGRTANDDTKPNLQAPA